MMMMLFSGVRLALYFLMRPRSIMKDYRVPVWVNCHPGRLPLRSHTALPSSDHAPRHALWLRAMCFWRQEVTSSIRRLSGLCSKRCLCTSRIVFIAASQPRCYTKDISADVLSIVHHTYVAKALFTEQHQEVRQGKRALG